MFQRGLDDRPCRVRSVRPRTSARRRAPRPLRRTPPREPPAACATAPRGSRPLPDTFSCSITSRNSHAQPAGQRRSAQGAAVFRHAEAVEELLRHQQRAQRNPSAQRLAQDQHIRTHAARAQTQTSAPSVPGRSGSRRRSAGPHTRPQAPAPAAGTPSKERELHLRPAQARAELRRLSSETAARSAATSLRSTKCTPGRPGPKSICTCPGRSPTSNRTSAHGTSRAAPPARASAIRPAGVHACARASTHPPPPPSRRSRRRRRSFPKARTAAPPAGSARGSSTAAKGAPSSSPDPPSRAPSADARAPARSRPGRPSCPGSGSRPTSNNRQPSPRSITTG